MNNRISRREFLQHASTVALGAGLGPTSALCADAQRKTPVDQFRRAGMLYRRLSKTDVFVSALSFGSHIDPAFKIPAEHDHVLTAEGQARRDRQIARAFDLGVNLVDTYENEGQWEPVARLVKPKRDKILVSLCRNLPMFIGEHIDRAAKLFGHVDLYRIYPGDGAEIDSRILENWDMMRKAKEAGKIRAIGIASHSEAMMNAALKELEGLDYIMFPYNFIHARADYSEFLPAAIRKGVGLIAIKPLAAGSILRLDPGAPAESKPENERTQFYGRHNQILLPSVVAELTKALEHLPGESLCQAALRFVYSQPFISTAMPGMFLERELLDNYEALQRNLELSRAETDVLGAAICLANFRGRGWLPHNYLWLDERWRA
jgi:aryl-alcohol dehydrogenase-like predicted oxidoreductase